MVKCFVFKLQIHSNFLFTIVRQFYSFEGSDKKKKSFCEDALKYHTEPLTMTSARLKGFIKSRFHPSVQLRRTQEQ